MVNKAVGDRLTCIFVYNGLMRKGESEQVDRIFRENLGMKLIHVDARERFLKKLERTSDPERKRRIIGREFIHVFEEEVHHRGELIALLWQRNVEPPLMGWKNL